MGNATVLSNATSGTAHNPTMFQGMPVDFSAILLTLFLAYAALCSSLRFRHEKAMRRRFNYPDRKSLARMTDEDAQGIVADFITYEFPSSYRMALQFALFKTYGIESLSRVLVASKSFSDPETAPKRFEDTTVIFGQFLLNAPTSRASIKAISRMNYLHSPYIKAGKILNSDLLYTLAVCITEPIRFVRLHEWRALNDMEVNACGCFWKSLGDAMEIEYKGYLSRDTWNDGIEFVQDITAWAKQYEMDNMKPAGSNTDLAHALTGMFMHQVPRPFKPFAMELLTVLMGDRVREAFRYPEPSTSAILTAYLMLAVRRLLLRHLALPRLSHVRRFSAPDPATGRITQFEWFVEPYYVAPTLWNQWGLAAWVSRAFGEPVPGAGGTRFSPGGFLFEEIGPEGKMGKGRAEMEGCEARIAKGRSGGGCPFSSGVGAGGAGEA